MNRGYTLIKLQRYAEALDVAAHISLLDPQLAEAYLLKSSAYCGLAQYKAALAACDQALSLDSNLAVAYARKGEILEALGKFVDGQRAHEKARKLGFNSEYYAY